VELVLCLPHAAKGLLSEAGLWRIPATIERCAEIRRIEVLCRFGIQGGRTRDKGACAMSASESITAPAESDPGKVVAMPHRALDAQWAQVYRQLHANPELSGAEYETAALVARELRAMLGWEVTEGVGGTGVVGVLRGAPGPTIWLRADMDALPVQQDTSLDYASTVSGVMHACGHDFHVTALLAACAELVSDDALIGTVVAIFQPAEETGAGARGMLEDGLLDRVPVPRIVLGQHVGPLPAGLIATRGGALMAASDVLRVRFAGIGGHASTPHLTVDPLSMAASMVLRLQSLTARQAALPASPVLTAGALHAGTGPTSSPIPPKYCSACEPSRPARARRCWLGYRESAQPRPKQRAHRATP
jgi:hippurate hydrolase